jgi:Cytochrome c7 and related cytochrome c
MAQIFHRSTNTIAKASIYGGVFILAFLTWVFMILDRSSYNTRQGVVLKQPVPFSHDHHVAGLGIDCRYCHSSVEQSSFAGMPPTQTCMNCHSHIWTNAELLEPVRESWRSGQPIAWRRVNDLPDFVYFNHSIHVAKGIGCTTCHGPVGKMPLMYQASSLQMEWCLDCHRNPERYVRPKDQVFNPEYVPAESQATLGPRLVAEYGIQRLDNCSICHR